MLSKKQLKNRALIFISIAGLILIGLAFLVHYHNVLGLDVFLSKDLQAEGDTPERKTFIYHVLYAISLFGKPLIAGIMTVAISLLFLFYKYYRESIYMIVTPISALIGSLVKLIVNRPRPTTDLVQVLANETEASFPSGHVLFYTVFFGLLFVLLIFTPKIPKAIRYLLQGASLFLIASVSFSRVYLGVHWVTDTVGGYLLGLIILVSFLYFYFRPKLKRKA
jgi:undecaprenyl-diphosphatase